MLSNTEIILNDKFEKQDSIADLPSGLTWTYRSLEGNLLNNEEPSVGCIYLEEKLLKKHNPNYIFGEVYNILKPNELFSFTIVTAENIKLKLSRHFSPLFLTLYYPFHFVFRRVFPKLKGFRKISRILELPVDISKSEILGRLIYKGFEIISVRETNDETCITAKIDKKKNPGLSNKEPIEGIWFKMNRLGKNGEKIIVYKFRSMHPYAEYVQAYIHDNHGLDSGGKFKNDFRVSTGGRIIRKYWIDEIPMLLNLFKGDIKLIGVRPISEHYFELYPDELKSLRKRNMPGLIPPFYADLPKTFDEIIKSEIQYLQAFEKSPVKTDAKYFIRILYNIFLKKARSQ